MDYPEALERLIIALQGLPSVGPKSAARLAFHLLHSPRARVEELAHAMLDVQNKIHACARCANLTDQTLCRICQDTRRDPTHLCVVADAREVMALERTREFKGVYHVLGGLISPLDGIGPDQLRVADLLARLEREPIREVILATNPTVAGEATALYLQRQFTSQLPVTEGRPPLRVTRLALGLPVGSDLEYADELTLGRALAGRRDM